MDDPPHVSMYYDSSEFDFGTNSYFEGQFGYYIPDSDSDDNVNDYE